MSNKYSLSNLFAIFTFILAKISGILGVTFGFSNTYHSLGGKFLILSGLFLVITVTLCILEMRQQNQEDNKKQNIIKNMLQDGSLQQYLQDTGFKIVKK